MKVYITLEFPNVPIGNELFCIPSLMVVSYCWMILCPDCLILPNRFDFLEIYNIVYFKKKWTSRRAARYIKKKGIGRLL